MSFSIELRLLHKIPEHELLGHDLSLDSNVDKIFYSRNYKLKQYHNSCAQSKEKKDTFISLINSTIIKTQDKVKFTNYLSHVL